MFQRRAQVFTPWSPAPDNLVEQEPPDGPIAQWQDGITFGRFNLLCGGTPQQRILGNEFSG